MNLSNTFNNNSFYVPSIGEYVNFREMSVQQLNKLDNLKENYSLSTTFYDFNKICDEIIVECSQNTLRWYSSLERFYLLLCIKSLSHETIDVYDGNKFITFNLPKYIESIDVKSVKLQSDNIKVDKRGIVAYVNAPSPQDDIAINTTFYLECVSGKETTDNISEIDYTTWDTLKYIKELTINGQSFMSLSHIQKIDVYKSLPYSVALEIDKARQQFLQQASLLTIGIHNNTKFELVPDLAFMTSI